MSFRGARFWTAPRHPAPTEGGRSHLQANRKTGQWGRQPGSFYSFTGSRLKGKMPVVQRTLQKFLENNLKDLF